MFRISAAALCIGLAIVVPLGAAEVEVIAPEASKGLRKDLRAASLAAQAVREKVTDGQELLAAAKADYRRMVAALYAAGHFGGTVSVDVDGREASTLSVLRRLPTINAITIRVTPGPRYRFSTAQVAPLPKGIPPVEGFEPGALATTPVMRRAAERAIRNLRAKGHAKAQVSGQQITAQHATTSIAARIDLAPGPRLRFGKMILSQSSQTSKVRPNRIRAIAGLPKGEVFSPNDIEDAERRLRNSGAFRSAVVREAEDANPDDTLDMTLDVEDAKPRRIGFGAEISNTEGLAGTAFWMHRNLLGGAERFRVDANIKGIAGDSGGIDYGLAASLSRPAFLHPDMSLRFAAKLQHLDEPAYVSNLIETTVGVERYINDKISVELDLGTRFSHVTDAFGTRNFNHVIGQAMLTWDNRNDELDPTKGTYAQVTASPFVGIYGSETGARLYGDFRGYVPLQSGRFSLAGRVQAGTVTGASLAGTPPSYLFFSGGGGTVRGQDYQSLGGTTVAGQTVGGRSFLGLTGELRAKITDNIGVVGFVDYGYVSPAAGYTGGDWHGGAGIGGRYYTPIGPIRFDVALPITGEKGFGVYVGIGQSF